MFKKYLLYHHLILPTVLKKAGSTSVKRKLGIVRCGSTIFHTFVTSRKAHERRNPVSVDGSPLPFNLKARSMLCSDGEAIIMNAVFTPFVLAAFKEAEVDYLKLGPSCTKVQQAWDAGTLFRDAKCGLQFVVAQQYKLLDERFRLAMFGSKEEGCNGFFAAMFVQFPNATLKSFWSAKQQER